MRERITGRAVLVTGASGFIGSHLARRLVTYGARVHAMSRRTGAAAPHALGAEVHEWQGDVTDAAACRTVVQATQPDIIVHLAADTSVRRFSSWQDIDRSISVNLTGTMNMLGAAAETPSVTMFLRAGGLEEYGTGPIPFDEAQRERPSSPYSASQTAGTHYAQMVQPRVPFAIVTLRPALIYGPGQSRDFLIPALISSCLQGRTFEISSGDQHRELLYIDDAVDAFCTAMGRPELRGDILNIGTGREHSVRRIAETVTRLLGTPELLRVGAGAARSSDLAHLVSHTRHASTRLDWSARIALEEGLERTVEWFRRHREDARV